MPRKRLIFVAVFLLSMLFVLPISAQNASPDIEIDIQEGGVAVYMVDAAGNRTLVIFVPIATITEVATTVEVSADDAVADDSTPMATEEPSDIFAGGYLIVNIHYLNMRSGDGTDYTIVGVVGGGETVDVVGRNENRSWWYIDANGRRGWVNGVHVLIRGDLTNVPVIEPVGAIIQPTLYVDYAGNGLFPTLPHTGQWACVLPGKSEFPIVGRSGGGNWYQIEATCDTGDVIVGWIQANRGIVKNPAGVSIPVTYR